MPCRSCRTSVLNQMDSSHPLAVPSFQFGSNCSPRVQQATPPGGTCTSAHFWDANFPPATQGQRFAGSTSWLNRALRNCPASPALSQSPDGSSRSASPSDQSIPNSQDRQEPLRLGGIILDLLTQP